MRENVRVFQYVVSFQEQDMAAGNKVIFPCSSGRIHISPNLPN